MDIKDGQGWTKYKALMFYEFGWNPEDMEEARMVYEIARDEAEAIFGMMAEMVQSGELTRAPRILPRACKVKRVSRSGGALVVYVKDLCNLTGARYWDLVKVSLEPIDMGKKE